MKLGVYIATHNNPMFLRLALLQLEAQTVRPDMLAIHENGHPFQTADLISRDVLRRLSQTTQIMFDHTEAGLAHPYFHYLPLKRLVHTGRCDLYTKWDHDDIFYETHLEELAAVAKDYPWIGKRRADILVLNQKQYVFKQNREFTWNPLGGMSDTFMFNHDVANWYLSDMLERAGKNEADDWILHKYTLPRFPQGIMLNHPPTTCYVSHGRNDSTSHWITKPPDDLK
jgi:hypothetical protein